MPDGAYDHETRTIAVTCGDIWGGGSAVLTFEAVVEAAALGQSSANIAHTHGSIPSEDPDTVPSNPDPGKPTDPPADEPLASSDPVEPPTIIPDDPGRENLSIAKTAENASRDDGTTHVGDTVRYRIALANSGPATGWMDAVIRDDVPRGLEPIANTIRLALPDGREVAVDDGAYDPATRILAVAVGHLYGGQEAALSFDALVTKDALDTDIGNVGTAFGTPPSQWDPDRPAPGARATPSVPKRAGTGTSAATRACPPTPCTRQASPLEAAFCRTRMTAPPPAKSSAPPSLTSSPRPATPCPWRCCSPRRSPWPPAPSPWQAAAARAGRGSQRGNLATGNFPDPRQRGRRSSSQLRRPLTYTIDWKT